MTVISDYKLQLISLIKTQLLYQVSHVQRDTEIHVTKFCSISSFKLIT